MLFDAVTSEMGRYTDRCLARKELGDGFYCFVGITSVQHTKRPRNGPVQKTWSIEVALWVKKDPAFLKIVNRHDGITDKDGLWDAVSQSWALWKDAPAKLCTHCHGALVWPGTDCCLNCSLGLQNRHWVDSAHSARREGDLKVPQPRP